MIKNLFRISLKSVVVILILFGLSLFFSYRILQVPLGLTYDEGSFGYNAFLLARTGSDETGAKYPLFAYVISGKDWRQPVTQYFITVLYKIFDPSVFLLRFSSVLVILVSAILIWILGIKIGGKKVAFFTSVFFLTTPLIMIQSHLGLDNIMTIPFTILWLTFIYIHEKRKSGIFLFLAGVSLGIGFYTYKGMRGTVPVWCILTVLYVYFANLKEGFKKAVLKVLLFILGVLPFFLIIPYLERHYPLAVFPTSPTGTMSPYDFFYPYVSTYDPGFLFVKGDNTPFHSTGIHGMFLLSTLPIFVIGIYRILKSGERYWRFLLASFLTAPLLYGLVGSVHRASRIMCMIPVFALICSYGAIYLWGKNLRGKLTLFVIGGVMFFNYWDFTQFYWYKYPEITRIWFGNLSIYKSYQLLSEKAGELELISWVDSLNYDPKDMSTKFFEKIYFKNGLRVFGEGDTLPPDAILMTGRKNVPGMHDIAPDSEEYLRLQIF